MKHKIIQIPDNWNKILVVGEAPGSEETASVRYNEKYQRYIGKPFIGSEGQYLRNICRHVNFPFENCIVTNTVHERPSKNVYETLPKEVIDEGVDELKKDIIELDPTLIIAIGGKALEPLCGVSAITKYRGSVLPCTLVSGYKVFATVHPGFIFKGMPQYDIVLKMDLGKVQKEFFKEIVYPKREINVIYEKSEALKTLYSLCYHQQLTAVDIETAGSRLLAFGVATSKEYAIVIPKELLKDTCILKAVSEFCDSQTPKLFHNGLYDAFYLAYHYKIYTRNYVADSLIAQHAIFPSLPKSLAFCASLYTQEPYWKCLKGDSEVLTRKGWKRLDTLDNTVEAMTSDSAGNMEFTIAKVVSYPFKGDGVRIKNLRHDCWYTPNHRILTTTVHKTSNSDREAADMTSRCNIISGGVYSGQEASNFIRLLVAIQADASVRWDRNKEVYFYLKKESKIERLKKLCHDLNVEIIEFPSGHKRDRLECQIKGDIVDKIVAILGPKKDFGPYLLDFDQPTLLDFLHELPYWDGWITYGGEALNYSSNNVNNIEWVATIGHCCGYTAHIMKAAGDRWKALKVSLKETDCVTFKPKDATLEHFEGNVYCLSTETGYFLCRSNGHIFLTGNSEGKEVTKDYSPNKIIDWPAFYIYNGKDCCVTYEVYEKQQEELDYWKTRPIYDLMIKEVDHALYSQLIGSNVNWQNVEEFKRNNEKSIEVLTRIKNATIGELNCSSHKQCGELLYDKWKLPERTKKGKRTTEDAALTFLESLPVSVQPCIGIISKMRELTKLRGYYDIEVAEDGNIHWSNKITGTSTGRWSTSSDIVTNTGMNLQNQPPSVRYFYEAPKDHIFIEWDLSNVDARFVAALCLDSDWLASFDIIDNHSLNAVNIFGLQPFYEKTSKLSLEKTSLTAFASSHQDFLKAMYKKVREKYDGDKSYRDYAKRIGHAVHYLEGPGKLSLQLGCAQREAKSHITKYKALRPSLDKWHERVNQEVGKSRIIRTFSGRVLQFFGPFYTWAQQLPAAVAAEPQSSAGDYLMLGAIKAFDEIPEIGFSLQVHDSIRVIVKDDLGLLKTILPKIKKIVEFTAHVKDIDMVIPAEFKMGKNWGLMKKVEMDNIEEVYRSLP